MARRKAATKNVKPEAENKDVGEQEAGGQEGHGFAPGISKVEAVRRALAAGFDGPQEGTAYIQKEFGIEVSTQHFSSTKSQLKSKEGKSKPGRKPRARVEGYVAPPSKGGSELLDAMEALKPLVADLGADQTKRLIDLLS